MDRAARQWILRHLRDFVPEELLLAAVFELRSTLGRARATPLRLPAGARSYLNLGCGGDLFDGFVGIDFFDHEGVYGADLRYPLLLADACVDGIFTEHTLEHFTFTEVERLLAECRRILKPGGRIRIVLPDIAIFVDRYQRRDRRWFAAWERHVLGPRDRRMISPMAAISFVTQEYGHRSAWDFHTLAQFLRQAGFARIRRVRFNEGADPVLLRDNPSPDRTMLSLYAEAVRPDGGERP